MISYSQQFVSTNVTDCFSFLTAITPLFYIYLQAITHIGLFTCTDKPILAHLLYIYTFCHSDVSL